MDEKAILAIVIIIAIALMTQRWFWALVGGFGGVAALFSMVASIIHFQILAAIGFLILTGICLAIFSSATEK